MRTFLSSLFLALMAASAYAAPPVSKVASGIDSAASTQLTPAQRGQIARMLVQAWAPEAYRKGYDVHQWAVKIGQLAGKADARNLQNAAAMPTYEAMLGVLTGQPARSPSVQTAINASGGGRFRAALLGSTTSDTTYTPLPNGRCRVAVSATIASPLPGATTRNIDVENVVSYAAQGGTGSTAGDGSTNCGIPAGVTSYAISVTVQAAGGGAGFFKIFANGAAFSSGNTVVYDTTYQSTSDVIVRSCPACSNELAIYSSTPANYIIDVIGYFMPPVATSLDCVNTGVSSFTILANAANFFNNPSCPAGYVATTPYCWTASTGVYSQGSGYNANTSGNTTFCSWQNTNAADKTVFGGNVCCRVPGR